MKWILAAGGSIDQIWFGKELEQIRKDASGQWKYMGIDAGVRTLLDAGIKPDYVIGDFDSVTPEEKESYLMHFAEKTVLDPVKDDTDMEAALRLAVSMGAEEIRIYGATGSRMDHTLTNMRLLAIPMEAGIPAVIMDPNNRITLISKETELKREKQYGRYISLLPFEGPVKGITLKGFKYPLEEGTLSYTGSLGVSNEITEEIGQIIFEEGRLFMMETKDEA